jgi:hypothetical protein
MIMGVPLGAQIDVLDCTSIGCPFESTRVVPVSHVPLTHGPFAAIGGGSAQPAITYGLLISTLGAPVSMTRGFGTVGMACPAWEQNTWAPTCTRNPGTVRS